MTAMAVVIVVGIHQQLVGHERRHRAARLARLELPLAELAGLFAACALDWACGQRSFHRQSGRNGQDRQDHSTNHIPTHGYPPLIKFPISVAPDGSAAAARPEFRMRKYYLRDSVNIATRAIARVWQDFLANRRALVILSMKNLRRLARLRRFLAAPE